MFSNPTVAVPPNAKTLEAFGGHVLQCKSDNNHDMLTLLTWWHPCVQTLDINTTSAASKPGVVFMLALAPGSSSM